jgi:hypothetical protein
MAVSPDLMFQLLSTVQSGIMPKPGTIASAATIAPVGFLTFLTGTVQVATITPPIDGAHMLALVFTDGAPGALLTTGNIKTAYTPIQNRVFLLFYDPSSAKYWVMTVT